MYIRSYRIPLVAFIVGKHLVRLKPEKDQSDHRLALAGRCQMTKQVPFPIIFLAQVVAKLCRDGRTSLFFINERWEMFLKWRVSVRFRRYQNRLIQSPMLALADQDRPLYVKWVTSEFVTRMRFYAVWRRRCEESRLLSVLSAASILTYPISVWPQLLAMKYALVILCVNLLEYKISCVYEGEVALLLSTAGFLGRIKT